MKIGIMNVVIVLIAGLIAFLEKRFSHKQMGNMALPWLNHSGTWANMFFISIILALVMPYYDQWSKDFVILCSIICGVIAISLHIIWVRSMPVPSYIVEPHTYKQPVGFYYNLLYTWVVFTPIALYFFATPAGVSKFWPSVLLAVYIPIATMGPGWYVYRLTEGAGRIDLMAWLINFVVWVTILYRNLRP